MFFWFFFSVALAVALAVVAVVIREHLVDGAPPVVGPNHTGSRLGMPLENLDGNPRGSTYLIR